ncbi:hypothetical protein E8E12_001309, partial [Didymella heteroderae]
LDHDSDHLPISTVIDIRVQQLEKPPKRDWRRLDEGTYHKALKQALPPLRRPANKTALDTYVQEVVKAIQKAPDQAIPYTRPSNRIREDQHRYAPGIALSAILYLFYNADLTDECDQAPDAMSTGYTDDVDILARSKTTDQACETLGKILEKAQRWSAHIHRSLLRASSSSPTLQDRAA